MTNVLSASTYNEHLKISQNNVIMITSLQKVGILASKVQCQCSQEMKMIKDNTKQDGRVWRCSKTNCKKKQTIRKGSYFEKSRLSLGKCWMLIVCHFKFPKLQKGYMAEIL